MEKENKIINTGEVANTATRGNAETSESFEITQNFKVMADAIPQILWILDNQGRTIFFNRQWSEYTGVPYSPSNANDIAQNFVHPDDAEMTMKVFQEANAARRTFEVEHRIRSAEGTYKWFLVRAEPKLDEQSNIVNWFGTSTDIHDRKITEAKLHKSEERKAFFLKLSDELRLLTDPAEIQYRAACIVGEYIGANRVGYAEAAPDGETVTVTRNYLNLVPGLEGTYKYMDYGPQLLHDMEQGLTVVRPDIANDPTLTPAEKEAHAVLQLGATVNVPLIKYGRLVAILFAHFIESHQWTDEELELIKETAERTWFAVELARAQKEQEKYEKHLEGIFASAEIGISEIDLTGRFINVNDTLCRLLGRKRDELLQLNIIDVTAKDYLHTSQRALEQVVTTAKPVSIDKQYITASGELLWANSTLSLLTGIEGQHTIIAVTADLTERKLAEQAVRVAETNYRLQLEEDVKQRTRELNEQNQALLEAQELGRIGNFYYDFAGASVKWSDELYRIMGVPKDESIDFEMATSFYTEIDRERMKMLALKCLETGRGFETEAAYTPRGYNKQRYLFIRAEVVEDGSGKHIGIKGIVQDITEAKIAERKLKENNDLLRSVSDTSLIGMSVLEAVRDDDGHIVDFRIRFVNKELENETGRKDLVGKIYGLEYPGIKYSGLFDVMLKVMESGEPGSLEYYYPYDGFNKWYSSMFVKNADGLVATTLDITERKQAEQKVYDLNTALVSKNHELESINAELTTFNNIAAHDYKDTLQTLYTNLEYIVKNDAPKLSNVSKGNIRKAQAAIQKLKLITDDIVAFSRIPSLDNSRTTVNLNETVAGVLTDMMAKITEKAAMVDTGDALPVIQGSPKLLSLLFYHLIDNALKFTERGQWPKISISYRLVHRNEVAVPMPYTNYHEVNVTDNGIGFDPTHTEELFSIFYRLHEKAKYKGSGIGLAVCKKIMDLHNGYITAQAHEVKGATFKCYFPA